MCIQGEEILHVPMEYNVFRAPIDNDKNIIKEWEKAGYDRAVARVYETTAVCEEKEVIIKCKMSMGAVYRPNFLVYEITWRVLGNGSVHIHMQGERNLNLPYLPRLGLKLALPKTYQNVEYFGYGPQESYCDKHRAAYIDRFRATVETP